MKDFENELKQAIEKISNKDIEIQNLNNQIKSNDAKILALK